MADTKRRSVIKLAGSAAAVASTGMAGILATGRTPAYAQQKTVHWLRWVDFVPASDTLMRKELMPEAEKALGIKINFETVNGNDLQPRATAAIQSGSGPDLIQAFNNNTYIYANSVVDLTDLAEERRQGGGRPLQVLPLAVQRRQDLHEHAVGGDRRHDRLPQVVVRRSGRHLLPQDLVGVPRGRQEAEGQGPSGRPDARPHVRRRADLHLSLHVVVGRQGSRGRRQDRGDQLQGDDRVGEVHAGLLEGRLRRGRARLGRHQQQPRLPVANHLGHAERRLDLHRDPAQARSVPDREGHADEQGHPARAAAGGTRRDSSACISCSRTC